MASIAFDVLDALLAQAQADGRSSLLEHECYRFLAATGAEAAPEHRLIPYGEVPTPRDLDALPGTKVVLKVVSPDITHKTEAQGVRIVANEMGAVEAAHELMLHQVPGSYSAFLGSHTGARPPELHDLEPATLQEHIRRRLVGVLLCRFLESDAHGFATELFVGIRNTSEFGPIISAGFGGVEMETLASATVKGAAVAIAPTGLVDGAGFLEIFRSTLSYQRLSGRMRGSRRLVSDSILEECFAAFIDVANHFSVKNPGARFHIQELEVNPFSVVGAHLAPLDGVCSFAPATAGTAARPLAKIGRLLEPR